ncbi:MAG: hypothetical protein RCO49_09030 [Rickettsia endosymbiont of Argas persicus]
MPENTNQKTISEAEKAINDINAGIRNFKDYQNTIFDNAMYQSNKPLDIEKVPGEQFNEKNDPYQIKSMLTDIINATTPDNILTKQKSFQKFIDEAISKGASKEELKEIQERVTNYPKEYKEKFSNNEKANIEMQKYMRRQIISNSIDFTEADGRALDNNKRNRFLNKVFENNDTLLPDALYKKYVATDPTLRPTIVNSIVGEEMKKFFGKEEIQDGVTYHTLDESKITPENIEKFNQSVNEKLQKVNDKLITNEKVAEELTKADPSITKTQIEHYQNALSKLDPQ